MWSKSGIIGWRPCLEAGGWCVQMEVRTDSAPPQLSSILPTTVSSLYLQTSPQSRRRTPLSLAGWKHATGCGWGLGIFRHYCTAMIWPSRSTVNRAIFVFDSRTLSALKVMNLKICPHRHFTRFDCWRQSNKCMYCVFRLCFDCYIQWIQQLCNRTVIIELPLLVV